ncbi:abortive infection system antitoxin AbiGi family protein [Aeromonas caviae]|uniref:abortive infection system antitoxin AbiGi family protein n=1 Tax=Aeromonas caviae TaxID=648 RepID=UPI002B48BEE6|nr:abortive infection system antitoxin AbiGi family protein [Aeromonas caviae]
MAISTNSIIHYTGSYKALTSILEEGFKVKYCLEKLYLHDEVSNAAHPMVSFCDIPLSDSTQHFSAYGKYGIGLSKEWAIKNGVNPVIYIDRNSLFAKSIEGLIKERRRDDSNLTEQQKGEILRIKSYAKNYSGELTRKNVKKMITNSMTNVNGD